jgi:maltooligosyltrehalose trehalohydrolase
MSPFSSVTRKLPIGAEPLSGGGVHFRVWAPKRRKVHVVLESIPDGSVELVREDGGYFAGVAEHAGVGSLYRFRLDDGSDLFPDPASRYQPKGVHGPSEVIDPSTFQWTDHDWAGVSAHGQVLYELHVGTFTSEGTFDAARARLPFLADVGITCIEMMPVNDFAGEFGWGYDGVDLFAPTRLYGRPDDLRRFIDEAHRNGIGVILDVVYNHIGPDGNYLPQFTDTFFTKRRKLDWGEPINFDGEGSAGVREFFLSNARYWIEEFHFDGFRLDATQAIFDRSDDHILTAITRETRRAAGGRKTYLISENEPQHTKLVRPEKEGGIGQDGLWNDDFHHTAMLVVSGRKEAYYTDYDGTPQEFVSGAKYGYLYQGQIYRWQKKRRGTPGLDLPPTAFVNFIPNHDQIANFGTGERAHKLGAHNLVRAMTALLLLGPQTPMLFQGQEFAANSRFNYFADHNEQLGNFICQGRTKELEQFPSFRDKRLQALVPKPCGERSTFENSKLDWDEVQRPEHQQWIALHRDLLRLRRTEPALSREKKRGDVDGAVLTPFAFCIRFFEPMNDDRLLLVNLGLDGELNVAPEPLLAAPYGTRWTVQWSSEDPAYGGGGVIQPENNDEEWRLPGENWRLPVEPPSFSGRHRYNCPTSTGKFDPATRPVVNRKTVFGTGLGTPSFPLTCLCFRPIACSSTKISRSRTRPRSCRTSLRSASPTSTPRLTSRLVPGARTDMTSLITARSTPKSGPKTTARSSSKRSVSTA